MLGGAGAAGALGELHSLGQHLACFLAPTGGGIGLAEEKTSLGVLGLQTMIGDQRGDGVGRTRLHETEDAQADL